MEQRKQFIEAMMRDEGSMSALCRRFGIIRKAGYKWRARFLAEMRAHGPLALAQA